jgi:hypothetical protein
VEGAGALLDDDVLARLGCDALVDGDGLRAERERLERDLTVPNSHVAVRSLGHGVGRRRVDDRDALRTGRSEQALDAGNDDVHPVTAEGVPRTRPGVGEVDVDERRTLTKADAPLEPSFPVDRRVSREEPLEGRVDVVIHRHEILPRLKNER